MPFDANCILVGWIPYVLVVTVQNEPSGKAESKYVIRIAETLRRKGSFVVTVLPLLRTSLEGSIKFSGVADMIVSSLSSQLRKVPQSQRLPTLLLHDTWYVRSESALDGNAIHEVGHPFESVLVISTLGEDLDHWLVKEIIPSLRSHHPNIEISVLGVPQCNSNCAHCP